MTEAPDTTALDDAVRPPSWTDETSRQASWIVGGPWGRYAAKGRWWTPVRVLLAMTVFTLALGYAQKSPCADGYWSHHEQYTHACYSDVLPLWSAEGLDKAAVPYRDHAVEYPILTGAFMWLTATLTRGLHAVVHIGMDFQMFAVLTAVLLAVCALFCTAATAGAAGRRPYDAAIFALSPLLVFHAFSNWDLLAMALASGALWAWARNKPVLAGALFGLGAAAKLYPIFLLLPIWVLALRTRIYRPAWYATVTAAAVWLAVNIPTARLYLGGWKEFYTFSADRTAEASTFWFMFNDLRTVGLHPGIPPGWVPPGLAVAVAVLLGFAVVAILGLAAPVRPRMGQLAFLVVLAFLLTTKVWSPQYSLWLVPLLALARPRWRLALIWQFTEIGVWILTLLWLLDFDQPNKGVDYGTLMAILLVRDALLLLIAALIVFEMWHPEADVVRASGLDDPGGGPYDEAPDRVLLARHVPPLDQPVESADRSAEMSSACPSTGVSTRTSEPA